MNLHNPSIIKTQSPKLPSYNQPQLKRLEIKFAGPWSGKISKKLKNGKYAIWWKDQKVSNFPFFFRQILIPFFYQFTISYLSLEETCLFLQNNKSGYRYFRPKTSICMYSSDYITKKEPKSDNHLLKFGNQWNIIY